MRLSFAFAMQRDDQILIAVAQYNPSILHRGELHRDDLIVDANLRDLSFGHFFAVDDSERRII